MSVALRNGEPTRLSNVPEFALGEFRDKLLAGVRDGGHVTAMFGLPEGSQVRVYCVIGRADEGLLVDATR